MTPAYIARKSAGLCILCEEPPGPKGTATMCRGCADYRATQHPPRARRPRPPGRPKNHGRLDRKAAGVCVALGCALSPGDGRMCRACRDRRNERQRALRRRRSVNRKKSAAARKRSKARSVLPSALEPVPRAHALTGPVASTDGPRRRRRAGDQ